MNGWAWFLIGFFVVSALCLVAEVDREQEPTSPAVAVGGLILAAVCVFAVTRAVL